MFKNSYVVPWTTKSEWQDVRKKIYSEKVEDVIEAYEIMSMWQMRCNNVPAYVDCTAGILQVMVQEFMSKNSGLTDHDLRLSYSTALIRFINHVHGISEHRNNTLYHSAKTQNIPDWLITMRHDAAHSQRLPALETFHLAAKVSLQWLLENYWVKEEKMINNLGAKHFEDYITINNLDLSLLPIYKTAIEVWGTCYDLMKNSLNLNSDLSEEQLLNIRELIHLCETRTSLKKEELNCVVWLKKIMNFCRKQQNIQPSRVRILKCLKIYLTELLKSMTKDDAARYAFIQSLLQSDFMLDTSQKEWENIIHLVQALKCFSLFLECLCELAGDENDMAVNLLETLHPSIEVQRRLWTWYQNLSKLTKSEKLPKKKLKHMAKIKRKKGNKKLIIQLRLQEPPKITVEMVQKIFSYPTERSCKVGFKYLSFVDVTSRLYYGLEHVTNVYFQREENQEDVCSVSDKIFTLDDVKNEYEKNDDGVVTDYQSQTWGRSEGNSETWSTCPLGLLPHQKAVDCRLPEGVRWILEKPEERKRASGALLTSQSEGMKKMKISLKNIDK